MSGYAYVSKTRYPTGLKERKYFLSPSLPGFEPLMFHIPASGKLCCMDVTD